MKLSKLCKKFDLEFSGKDRDIIGLQTFENANEQHIVYLENEKFIDNLKVTKAGVAIINKKHENFVPSSCSIIYSENPHLTMAILSKVFAPPILNSTNKKPKISKNAIVMPHAYVGKGTIVKDDVVIMHGAYIGENVEIEEGSVVHPNAVVYNNTKIGKNCTILSGAIIGSDGFGYAHTKTGEHVKIYHTGNVVLEDNVEIGANTTVDRAVFGSTIIKKGTKIDNIVQVGHNCTIGENCLLISHVGISGSTKLGKNVIMAGQSGAAGHISIGDFAVIAAKAGVTKSLSGHNIYNGVPAMPNRDFLKLNARMIKFFLKDRE